MNWNRIDWRTGFMRTRIKRTRRMRRGPARSLAYRKWIASQACLICETAPSQAAHTGSDKGMRMKPEDFSCVPLCPVHHDFGHPGSYHELGRKGFEQLYGVDLDAEVRRLNRAFAARN